MSCHNGNESLWLPKLANVSFTIILFLHLFFDRMMVLDHYNYNEWYRLMESSKEIFAEVPAAFTVWFMEYCSCCIPFCGLTADIVFTKFKIKNGHLTFLSSTWWKCFFESILSVTFQGLSSLMAGVFLIVGLI